MFVIRNESEFLIMACGISLVTDEKFTLGGTCTRATKLNMSLRKKDDAGLLEFGPGANNRTKER